MSCPFDRWRCSRADLGKLLSEPEQENHSPVRWSKGRQTTQPPPTRQSENLGSFAISSYEAGSVIELTHYRALRSMMQPSILAIWNERASPACTVRWPSASRGW